MKVAWPLETLLSYHIITQKTTTLNLYRRENLMVHYHVHKSPPLDAVLTTAP